MELQARLSNPPARGAIGTKERLTRSKLLIAAATGIVAFLAVYLSTSDAGGGANIALGDPAVFVAVVSTLLQDLFLGVQLAVAAAVLIVVGPTAWAHRQWRASELYAVVAIIWILVSPWLQRLLFNVVAETFLPWDLLFGALFVLAAVVVAVVVAQIVTSVPTAHPRDTVGLTPENDDGPN
jgi:MFS family permease